MKIPRQCIFAASTNRQDWNRDETGARRFWLVWCNKADVDRIVRDRDQLWAEARTRYESGAMWHLPAELLTDAREEQEARYDRDPWDSVVWDWLIGDRSG